MKLHVPFVQLPISFDAARLAEEVRRIEPEQWRAHPNAVAGNSALTLVTRDGDPDSDELSGPMRPTPVLQRLPYTMQVMEALGATWGRSRLMRLSGRSEVPAHVDTNYYWRERMRVHVPIVTTPDVRFQCGDLEVNMAAGECWVFDTWRHHRVINQQPTERIHLVLDTVGGGHLWDLINRGFTPGPLPPGWRAPLHAFAPDRQSPVLAFESVNAPRVMSPWEIREHIVFLLAEAVPDGRLGPVQRLLLGFARQWHALWSRFGESDDGLASYADLLDRTRAQLVTLGAEQLGLRNEVGLLFMLDAYVFNVALEGRESAANLDVHGGREPGETPVQRRQQRFDRPVFIVSPPRSGSTLLFETLMKAPDLHTIGDESHALIEGIASLAPRSRDFDSNRLLAADADRATAETLRIRFLRQLRDRNGNATSSERVRMLEKTPKNALRIPFLRETFPGARFIYLHRDPRQTLASMIEGWHSGQFVTYPDLPGWRAPAWSFLLTPGWQALAGKPLADIVASQWANTMQILLDDLQQLDSTDWIGLDYDAFLADPAAQVSRICDWAEWRWDQPISSALPHSRYTLTAPATDKWKRHAADIEPRLAAISGLTSRAAEAARHRQQ